MWPCPSVQLQQSPERDYYPVKGASTVAVAGWETHRVRGWLQKALSDLCSTFLFLGQDVLVRESLLATWSSLELWRFSKEMCQQPIFPPPPVGFFPFTLQISPTADLLISSFFPQHKVFCIRVSLSRTHHIRKPHHVVYVAEWLCCAVVLTSFKKIIVWEVVWLLNGSKDLMAEKGNGKQHTTGKEKEEAYEEEITTNPAFWLRASQKP